MSHSMSQKCPYCGSPRNIEHQFCGNCGEQLIDNNALSEALSRSKSSASAQKINQVYESSYSTILSTTKSQGYTAKSEEWFNLRWFIFASSLLCLILLLPLLLTQNSIIISLILFLGIASLLLGFIQSFHFNQWYWLSLILTLGPLANLLYSCVNPAFKQRAKLPSRQLIIVLLLLGFVLFGIAVLPITGNIMNNIYGFSSIDLLLAGSILTIISILKLGWRLEYDLEVIYVMFFMCFLPLSSLIYMIFYYRRYKKELEE